MRSFILAGAVLLAAASGSLRAQDEKAAALPPPLFQSVLDCEKETDPEARLACFDRTVAALAAAHRDRELAVVDRSSMREARRGIFGLSLPRLKLFDSDESEEVTAIDSTIAGVRMAKDGMPIFVLADGARWKQTEGRNVFPKAGNPIHIRRAAMGSYMANVNKQPGVRVVRISE